MTQENQDHDLLMAMDIYNLSSVSASVASESGASTFSRQHLQPVENTVGSSISDDTSHSTRPDAFILPYHTTRLPLMVDNQHQPTHLPPTADNGFRPQEQSTDLPPSRGIPFGLQHQPTHLPPSASNPFVPQHQPSQLPPTTDNRSGHQHQPLHLPLAVENHSGTQHQPIPLPSAVENHSGPQHQFLHLPPTSGNRTNVINSKALRWSVAVGLGILLLCVLVAVVVLLVNQRTSAETSQESQTGTTRARTVTTPNTGRTTPQPVPSNPDCDPQCDPVAGCDMLHDPTQCHSCRNAEVNTGLHVFCVESCEAAGSLTDSATGQCQERRLVGIVSLGSGVTCTASSVHNDDFVCEHALDGTESQWAPLADGAGVWIELQLPGSFLMAGIQIDSRTAAFSQCTTYTISIDGAIFEQISWECAEGRHTRDYFFRPTRGGRIRIQCTEDCGPGGAQGFRNLQVYTIQN